MLDKKISAQGVLIIFYLITIFFLGIVFVPCYEVWGPEKNISGYYYVFLLNLKNSGVRYNGFEAIYEIDYLRTLYTIGIITLITAGTWILLNTWNKEDKSKPDV